ncbi:hypothetical protein [Archaeoglobus sp.]|jgi:hypothetical protein|uniref:hypothetical protein n=1 Tax=Archaeoglobus sp. TaxID=1872626 RepID=UPI0024AA6B07|nr:hypothetical protein [Archaeoglobus sp.]MDI3497875.1 hypothetical protein [Archaeoglobus sp.]
MVSEAEFMVALTKFAETSATASAAADRVIAVANVDASRIADGFNALLGWAMKIATLLLEGISKNPSLKAEMAESHQMLFGNLGTIVPALLKFGPYINQILGNFGLSLGKLFEIVLGF